MRGALNKMRQGLAGGDVEGETARNINPELATQIVRVKANQKRKHKVISYGYRVLINGNPPESYKIMYHADPEGNQRNCIQG